MWDSAIFFVNRFRRNAPHADCCGGSQKMGASAKKSLRDFSITTRARTHRQLQQLVDVVLVNTDRAGVSPQVRQADAQSVADFREPTDPRLGFSRAYFDVAPVEVYLAPVELLDLLGSESTKRAKDEGPPEPGATTAMAYRRPNTGRAPVACRYAAAR